MESKAVFFRGSVFFFWGGCFVLKGPCVFILVSVVGANGEEKKTTSNKKGSPAPTTHHPPPAPDKVQKLSNAALL